MSEHEEAMEFTAVLTETDWMEICERGHFRCKFCCDCPPIEDLDIFIESGACAHCDAVDRKFAAD